VPVGRVSSGGGGAGRVEKARVAITAPGPGRRGGRRGPRHRPWGPGRNSARSGVWRGVAVDPLAEGIPLGQEQNPSSPSARTGNGRQATGPDRFGEEAGGLWPALSTSGFSPRRREPSSFLISWGAAAGCSGPLTPPSAVCDERTSCHRSQRVEQGEAEEVGDRRGSLGIDAALAGDRGEKVSDEDDVYGEGPYQAGDDAQGSHDGPELPDYEVSVGRRRGLSGRIRVPSRVLLHGPPSRWNASGLRRAGRRGQRRRW